MAPDFLQGESPKTEQQGSHDTFYGLSAGRDMSCFSFMFCWSHRPDVDRMREEVAKGYESQEAEITRDSPGVATSRLKFDAYIYLVELQTPGSIKKPIAFSFKCFALYQNCNHLLRLWQTTWINTSIHPVRRNGEALIVNKEFKMQWEKVSLSHVNFLWPPWTI